MYLRTNSHVHHFRMYQFLSQMIVLVTALFEAKELSTFLNRRRFLGLRVMNNLLLDSVGVE